MKEAAGEANMTVVTIVLIAIVLTVGGVIVTSVMRNVGTRSNQTNNQTVTYTQASCQQAGGTWNNNACNF